MKAGLEARKLFILGESFKRMIGSYQRECRELSKVDIFKKFGILRGRGEEALG